MHVQAVDQRIETTADERVVDGADRQQPHERASHPAEEAPAETATETVVDETITHAAGERFT